MAEWNFVYLCVYYLLWVAGFGLLHLDIYKKQWKWFLSGTEAESFLGKSPFCLHCVDGIVIVLFWECRVYLFSILEDGNEKKGTMD